MHTLVDCGTDRTTGVTFINPAIINCSPNTNRQPSRGESAKRIRNKLS
jgi:hypothetical protein